jgi:hypothetical protein
MALALKSKRNAFTTAVSLKWHCRMSFSMSKRSEFTMALNIPVGQHRSTMALESQIDRHGIKTKKESQFRGGSKVNRAGHCAAAVSKM